MPRGVLGCIQDEGTCFAGKCSTQFVGIECPGWRMQWHVDRNRVRHYDIWHVRIVIRLDNDHLVTRIDQPQDGGEDSLRGTRGDNNSSGQINIQIVEACRVVDDSLAYRDGSRTGGV